MSVKIKKDNFGFKNPVEEVLMIDIDKVEPNDYNPNSMNEYDLELLYLSIKEDGYTQPIVTYYDDKKDKYIIVDGYHRYFVAKRYKDIRERNNNKIPIVVIKKDLSDRMASTVRHNRARGSHSVIGMSELVYKMLEQKQTDEEIVEKLGLTKDEFVKIKLASGYDFKFKIDEYSKIQLNSFLLKYLDKISKKNKNKE